MPNYIREMATLLVFTALRNISLMASTSCRAFTSIKVAKLAELMFYKNDRNIDWRAPDLEKQFPPDAIFSSGKWLKVEHAASTKNLEITINANYAPVLAAVCYCYKFANEYL